MQVARQTTHGDLHTEPAYPQMPVPDLRELVFEACFIGAVALALVVIVLSGMS